MIGVVNTVEEFEIIRKYEKKVYFKFTATWCVPCKTVDPALAILSKQHLIYNIDVDKLSGIADVYNINNIPTILMFENGVCNETRFSGSHIENMKNFFSYI